MGSLTEDIAFYEEHKAQLEADHFAAWVLVHDRRVIGFFDTFQDAALHAVTRFGRGALPHPTDWLYFQSDTLFVALPAI